MGDGKTRIGSFKIRLWHMWKTYETIDKNSDKGIEGRNSRDSTQW